jgi:hypothetical protein
VTVDYQVGGNNIEMTVPVTLTETQAPSATITAIPTSPVALNTPAPFTATIQNPYAGTTYTATWTFTSLGTGAQFFVAQKVETSTPSSSLSFTLTESFPLVGPYLVQLKVTNPVDGQTTTATYNGTPIFTVVAKVATNVSVILPGAAFVYNGQPYALPASSVTVTDTSGNVINNPSLSYAYSQVTSSGTTPISQAPTNPGTYQVVVTYAGDSTHLGSSSQPMAFTISPATPQVVLSGPASLTYDDLAYPLPTITVTGVNGVSLGTSGVTLAYSQLVGSSYQPIGADPTNAGSYEVVACYVATLDYASALSVPLAFVINPATPKVTVSAPNATYTAAPYTGYSATVTGVGGAPLTGATFTFYSGSTALSSAPTNAGTYSVVATYAATTNYSSASSSSVTFVIGQAPTTTTGTVSGLTFGLPTTFTATVKAGSVTPVGSVDFFDTTTGVDLGSVMLSSGVATLTTTIPSPETSQTITLTYSGSSANFTTSTSTVAVSPLLASIFVLNATAAGALNLSGSASISVPGTVQVDSSSASAVELSGSAKVTASTIDVVGGTSVTGSSGFSVTPKTKAPSIADPLAALPIPSATGMTTYAAVKLGGATVETISPGIYPSISVGGSAKLTMNPGVYVITGGGFTVSGTGVVTGSGVLIYNAGSNFNGGTGSTFGAISLSAGTVTLSPPATGVYAGISFFQSRDNTKTLTVSGAIEAELNGGAVYASAAQLQITGSGEIGGNGQPASPLVVNELLLSGSAQATPAAAVAASSGSGSSSTTSASTSSSTGSSSNQASGKSIATPSAQAVPTPKPSPSPTLGVIDSALASLYPTTATSPLSNSNVQHLDVAIEAVVEEPYVVPVEIAQAVSESTESEAGTPSAHKPSNTLRA